MRSLCPRVAGALSGAALLIAAAAPVASAQEAAAGCEEGRKVEDYAFALCPGREEASAQRLVISHKGEALFQVEDRKIEVAPPLLDAGGSRSALPPGRDITGNGQADAVIYSDSGGAHCCIQLLVLALTPEFKVLNRLDAGNYLPIFRQSDKDEALEIRIRDGIFAYWKAPFARSPAPPVILDFQDGRYRPAPELMRAPPLAIGQLRRKARAIRDSPRWDEDGRYPLDSRLWAVMLDLIYSGNLAQADEFLDQAWPRKRPGKQDFRRAFFECQLRLSFYWPAVAALNGLEPLPPARHCFAKAEGG